MALENAATLCGSPEARALHEALDGATGDARAPERGSAVYEDKGWIVLRDGWVGDRASHFMMSAVRPPTNHGHWDMGSFTLFARGRDFIGDPASHIYNGYHDAERRGYLYSMGAHNTLTVDDDELISYRELYRTWRSPITPCSVAAWSLGEKADFVTVYHDGYAPKRHVREVLFRKGRYWLVLDYLSGEDHNGAPDPWTHTIRRFVHFSFGVRAVVEDGVVVAESSGEALTLAPSESADMELDIAKDRILEPERRKLGVAETPDVLTIRGKARGPTVMALLIVPHAADERPPVAVRAAAVGDSVRVGIETPEGADVWETRTLTAPDGPAEKGSGEVVNVLTTPGGTFLMPAAWSERARFEFA